MAQGTNIITISNGSAVSTSYNLGGNSLMGILTPATLTAGSFKVQGSIDNTTWGTLTAIDGTELAFSGATSALVYFNPATATAPTYIRISGNIPETADRSFTVIAKGII